MIDGAGWSGGKRPVWGSKVRPMQDVHTSLLFGSIFLSMNVCPLPTSIPFLQTLIFPKWFFCVVLFFCSIPRMFSSGMKIFNHTRGGSTQILYHYLYNTVEIYHYKKKGDIQSTVGKEYYEYSVQEDAPFVWCTVLSHIGHHWCQFKYIFSVVVNKDGTAFKVV